jgi:hypothetical protein
MKPIEPPINEKTVLEKFSGDEFHVKKCSVYVFTISCFSYLLITIIRGKGSLPFWVQIPTILLYVSMVILVKLYGSEKKHQPMFNKVIPLFVLILYYPSIMFTDLRAYDSEVIWAFCLGT